MTLAQLRTLLYEYVSEGTATLSTESANLLINGAMQDVLSWLIAQNVNLVLVEWSGTLTNNLVARRVLVTIPAGYTRVRRVIEAERTYATTPPDDDPSLKVVDYDSTKAEIRGAPLDKPAVFTFNGQFGFVKPKNQIAVKVTYVPGLSNMELDSDSPGQSNGTGTANLMPEEAQVLIPSTAAVLRLIAENSDATQWRAMLQQQQMNLLGANIMRRRTQERP